MRIKNIFLVSFSLFFLAFFSLPINAQTVTTAPVKETRMEARVSKILKTEIIKVDGRSQTSQRIELVITKGEMKDIKVTVDTSSLPIAGNVEYNEGDRVVLVKSEAGGKEFYYIAEFIRRDSLYLLFAVFVGLTVLIGRKRGVASLLGMLISFFIIFNLVLNQIMQGQNPIVITIFASMLIIPITFYLSHGVNKKTTAAVLGTVISLILTSVLALIFVELSRLTGFASEEAVFVQSQLPDLINIKGLLYAGIIIGLLGILDDITVSQAAIVYQLRSASHKLTNREIFSRAMDIGRDHIASMVNTLVLVYTGAAMPLLLLFINNPRPFADVINNEIVAEEIVRTLVASIGLILAVPITTFIAAYLLKKD